MKKLILLIAVFISFSHLFGKPVDRNTAQKIASLFLSSQTKGTSGDVTLVYESTSRKHSVNTKQASDPLVYYYVFNTENGFIIVSGDDAVLPVLGYSTESTFRPGEQPSNFRKWLENYKKQITYVISNNIPPTEEIQNEWQSILNNNIATKNAKAVNPLVTTTWSQSPYVNEQCPYDADAGPENGYHCVTGCPATAMAQIMKYWNYPQQGAGYHSYEHPTYGTLFANFGGVTYDWASMPDQVNGTNEAVALLMYHCGVAVEMDYGPSSSGSYVIIDGYPETKTCEYAYKTYFGYDASSIRGLRRENYSDNDWKQLLKNDLDAGRPIQYAGFGQGGHTFVCDGYDSYDYFHMNWGWGGYADGFFLLDALNPGSGGTGSGAGTYNEGQQAVIGIQPPSDITSFNLILYDDLTISQSPVVYTQGFSVHTDIANAGNNTFNGDFGAAIFDENFFFVNFVEIKTDYALESGYHFSEGLDFTTSGLLDVVPGTYYVAMFYRPTDGDWKIINDGSYTNILQFDVINENDISLYSNMEVDNGIITRNQAFNVTVDIANYGSSDFNGAFSLNLYDIYDGSFVVNIETKTGMTLNAGYHYENGLTFSSNGLDVSPGTYLLAVIHKDNTQDNWELTGSSDYPNPIKVIVQEAPLQPDIYENNDSLKDAYPLPLTFTDNTAHITTAGSNNHVGTDLDYYELNLPEGYDYTISARIHDSYNSGDANTYTNDVGWSYLYNDEWSDVFDDVMPNDITVSNGGTLVFNVSPYFIGTSGSYLLDISITRSNATSITDIGDENPRITIYPNPVRDHFFVEATNTQIIRVEIFDISGTLRMTVRGSDNSSGISIPTEMLNNGIYTILITSKKTTERKKIIIIK